MQHKQLGLKSNYICLSSVIYHLCPLSSALTSAALEYYLRQVGGWWLHFDFYIHQLFSSSLLKMQYIAHSNVKV